MSNAGEWWAGGVTSFYRFGRRGGFSEGLGTSRHRRVNQGPTRQVGRLQVQRRDTSRRCHLTGSRHTTSLPPTRVHCPLFGYPSANFYLRRFNPFLFRRLGFFFLFDYRIRHCARFDTSPPGAFGRNGFHGEST